jgi:hypothetical protein
MAASHRYLAEAQVPIELCAGLRGFSLVQQSLLRSPVRRTDRLSPSAHFVSGFENLPGTLNRVETRASYRKQMIAHRSTRNIPPHAERPFSRKVSYGSV